MAPQHAYIPSIPNYVTWREQFRDSFYEVIIRPYNGNGFKESHWICDNLKGYFSFRMFYDTLPRDIHGGIIFVFQFEEDAMAFKLRWL